MQDLIKYRPLRLEEFFRSKCANKTLAFYNMIR